MTMNRVVSIAEHRYNVVTIRCIKRNSTLDNVLTGPCKEQLNFVIIIGIYDE